MNKKSKKKVKASEPEKVLVNVKILKKEKEMLQQKALKYARGNITKLIRLLAHGKFMPLKKAV